MKRDKVAYRLDSRIMVCGMVSRLPGSGEMIGGAAGWRRGKRFDTVVSISVLYPTAMQSPVLHLCGGLHHRHLASFRHQDLLLQASMLYLPDFSFFPEAALSFSFSGSPYKC